jgi:hypothetical protein
MPSYTTYLHAGAGEGWPADHKAEDTFDLPCDAMKHCLDTFTRTKPSDATLSDIIGPYRQPAAAADNTFQSYANACNNYRPGNPNMLKKPEPPEDEYIAEFGPDGSARLVVATTRIIANFNNFADAQTAAKALNELKGY